MATIPGTKLAEADSSCVSCHKDQHGGLTDCAGCHTPTAWTDVEFEHPFTLTGAHATLTCSQCHVSKPGGTTVAGTQFPAADPSASPATRPAQRPHRLRELSHPQGWTPANFTHPVVGEHGQADWHQLRDRPSPNGYGSQLLRAMEASPATATSTTASPTARMPHAHGLEAGELHPPGGRRARPGHGDSPASSAIQNGYGTALRAAATAAARPRTTEGRLASERACGPYRSSVPQALSARSGTWTTQLLGHLARDSPR